MYEVFRIGSQNNTLSVGHTYGGPPETETQQRARRGGRGTWQIILLEERQEDQAAGG